MHEAFKQRIVCCLFWPFNFSKLICIDVLLILEFPTGYQAIVGLYLSYSQNHFHFIKNSNKKHKTDCNNFSNKYFTVEKKNKR